MSNLVPFSAPPPFGEDLSLRLPPQNLEVEEAVLGAILIDPEAIARIEAILPSPLAFYSHNHRKIYKAALVLRAKDQPIDLMQVATWLQDAGLLEGIGGQSQLVRLLDRCVSTANVDAYAHVIAEKYLRRQLIAAARKIEQISYEETKPVLEALETSAEAIASISQQMHTSKVLSVADIATDAFSNIEARHPGLVKPGIPTGFYDLDAMTQGFQRTDLITAAARPAMGKSAWLTCCAANMAAQGIPSLIVSLEMSKEQVLYRLLSPLARITSGRLRIGRVAEHEWEPLGHSISQLSRWPIFIDDGEATTVAEIGSKAREVKAHQGDLGVIFVDYLQLMEGEGDNRVQALSKITRQFKRLAKKLNVAIVLLSQLSRGVESRTNKRPMLSDLRESGSIEQDSDLVMMLYREEYYDPDTPDRGIAELILSKHRNGPTGTVKLLFQPEFTLFLNRASLS